MAFRPRVRRLSFLLPLFVVWAGLHIGAQELKIPPAPDRWVTDRAGFLSPDTVASLDARLSDFERETGHQVIVYIDRTTGGLAIEEWAVKAFEAWKVGRKGLDDGLALMIMAEDRKARIEVGYGLEDRVPDIRAFRVINDILLPGFRSGRPDAAVSDAVSSLLSLISGRDEGPAPAGETEPRQGRRGQPVLNTIFVIAAVVFFLILFITNPSLAIWLLITMFTGGRGGGGGGGGGFRGGGGRSGGGGASGSW
jgi:uncharacterized protein